MKKFVMVLSAVLVLSLTSCGMAWQQKVKNFKSNYSGGLNREIVIRNAFTNETIWTFEGKAYIDDSSTSGNATIVYTLPSGEIKKYDVLGDVIITSDEK